MVQRIKPISPVHIFESPKTQPYVPPRPVLGAKDVYFRVQEMIQQEELNANLWCAWMKHQRRLFEIILGGKKYT